MNDILTQLRQYERSFDVAVGRLINYETGNTGGKHFITVSAEDTKRFCQECKRTWTVGRGEIIRDDCPYCKAHQDKLQWTNGLKFIDAPKMDIVDTHTTSQFNPNNYTSTDYCIDFKAWLQEQPNNAYALVMLRYVSGYTLRDIAKHIHKSYVWVYKVISDTRMHYDSPHIYRRVVRKRKPKSA